MFVPALRCPACPTQCLFGVAERLVCSDQLTVVLKGKLPVLIQTLCFSLLVPVVPILSSDLRQNFWCSTALCRFLDSELRSSICWTGSSPLPFFANSSCGLSVHSSLQGLVHVPLQWNQFTASLK